MSTTMTAGSGGPPRPTVSAGGLRFTWREDWAQWPRDDEARRGWAHHGLTVGSDGRLWAFHPGRSALLAFAPDGRLAATIDCPVREAHGLLRVTDGDGDRLWIADNAAKAVHTSDGSYDLVTSPEHGRVVKVDLNGRPVQVLPTPARPEYVRGHYSPTGVAVDEVRFGGRGDIWVCDGYGQNLVHRFTADGVPVATLTGAEGAGRFDCPHAVFIDRRGSRPELYIADRGHARIQVYGLDGTFHRVVGAGELTSPSGFAVLGATLIVAELHAALALFDDRDRPIGTLAADPDAVHRHGWPNAVRGDGTVPPPTVPGRFNSPHGLAVDGSGSIYVSEWRIGGRLVKLEAVGGDAGNGARGDSAE